MRLAETRTWPSYACFLLSIYWALSINACLLSPVSPYLLLHRLLQMNLNSELLVINISWNDIENCLRLKIVLTMVTIWDFCSHLRPVSGWIFFLTSLKIVLKRFILPDDFFFVDFLIISLSIDLANFSSSFDSKDGNCFNFRIFLFDIVESL